MAEEAPDAKLLASAAAFENTVPRSSWQDLKRAGIIRLGPMLEPYEGRVYDPCCGSGVSICPLNINAVSE